MVYHLKRRNYMKIRYVIDTDGTLVRWDVCTLVYLQKSSIIYPSIPLYRWGVGTRYVSTLGRGEGGWDVGTLGCLYVGKLGRWYTNVYVGMLHLVCVYIYIYIYIYMYIYNNIHIFMRKINNSNLIFYNNI